MKYGKLILIPTPIDSESKLNIEAFDILNEASKSPDRNILLVEDPKPAKEMDPF